MQKHDLTVKRKEILKAVRSNTTSKPKASEPNSWWGIDMTKVSINGFGPVYIVIVIDWFTKKVVGSYLKEQSKAKHWILALNEAINLQFPNGIKGNHLYLMSDNGSQPTSKAFTEECKSLGIKQVFTSYNNPKGNADTERFMRTMKEEIVWTEEWNDPTLFSKRFKEWIHYYNHEYLHSSLGYNAPVSYEKMFYEKFNNHE